MSASMAMPSASASSTWLLFLKIFDDREKEAEAIEDRYRSPIPANLRWRNWAANPEASPAIR